MYYKGLRYCFTDDGRPFAQVLGEENRSGESQLDLKAPDREPDKSVLKPDIARK